MCWESRQPTISFVNQQCYEHSNSKIRYVLSIIAYNCQIYQITLMSIFIQFLLVLGQSIKHNEACITEYLIFSELAIQLKTDESLNTFNFHIETCQENLWTGLKYFLLSPTQLFHKTISTKPNPSPPLSSECQVANTTSVQSASGSASG